MDLLAADPGQGLSLAEVSRRIEVHKATTHSMLSELLRAGWLFRDPVRKTYQLGPTLGRLGHAAAARFPALQMARPTMVELSVSTGGHCIAFSVGDDHVTVVDQVRNPRDAGHPMPMGLEIPTRPPYGASVAAWMGADDRERWLGLVPSEARDRYRRALTATRKRGYSVGLHVLPEIRLQELASVIRAAEVRRGRIGDLAAALTDELVHSEEWFAGTLSSARRYHVSHLDAPVFGPDLRPVLVLSLVPVPAWIDGGEVTSLGRSLHQAATGVTSALGGGEPPG